MQGREAKVERGMYMDKKKWKVDYKHSDGREGTVRVTTELQKSGAFGYGNGMGGQLTVDTYERSYDLRYCKEKDLHMVMLKEYFGAGFVSADEVKSE